jgi:signal peptidase I
LSPLYEGVKTVKEVMWNHETSYISGEFIQWPHPEVQKVEQSIPVSGSLKGWKPPTLQDKLLQSHLWRMKYTLSYWELANSRRKCLDSARLLRRNLVEGPEFADELDDAIKYTYRYQTSKCIMYSDNWDAEIREDAWGHDYFFPPCHLLPFVRQDPGDINLVFKEDPKVPEKLLRNFKQKVRENIQEGVALPFLDDVDRLTLFGGTKTFVPGRQQTQTRTKVRLQDPTLETTDAFKFKYAFVQKTAAEDRAAVVTDQLTLNTMRLLKRSLEAIRKCSSDTMGVKDWHFLPQWLGDVHALYLMSDLKKCGLTFPRQLLFATLEVFLEVYPDADIFRKGIDGYKNATIQLPDGSTRLMTTGVNLGMMNEYVSFIMGCLVELWIDQQGFEDVTALMYNDDQVIRFANPSITGSNSQELQDLGISWDTFMTRHGLSVHDKKSFWSDRGCFLEVYGRPSKITYTLHKETQYLGNLYWSLLSYNIVEAKEFCSGVISNLPERYIEKAISDVLPEIVSLWGYEFSPKECKFSYPIGWVKEQNQYGEYTLFDELYESEPFYEEARLCQIPLVSKPKKFNNSLRTLAKAFKNKYDWFISEINSTKSPAAIKQLVDSLCPPLLGMRKHDVFLVYQEWAKKRQEAYHSSRLVDPTIVITRILRENPKMHIPEELFLKKANYGDQELQIPFFESPSEESISLREYIAFAKYFGEYKNVQVDYLMTPTELRRIGNYFSFPHPGAEIATTLLQTFQKSKVYDFLNKFSYGSGTIPMKLFDKGDYWFPSFIPGKGYVVSAPDYSEEPFRVTYENYLFGVQNFDKYGPLVGHGLDLGIFSREELLPLRDELYQTFIQEFEKQEIEYPDLGGSIDLFRTATAGSDTDFYSMNSSNEQIELRSIKEEPPPKEQKEEPPPRQERVLTNLEYIQWQFRGVWDRLPMLGDRSQREGHLEAFQDPSDSFQEPDVFGDECSESGLFESLFTEE